MQIKSWLYGKTFGDLLILLLLVGFIIGGVIFIRAKKRGIDVTRKSFQLKVGIGLSLILIIFPFWLTPLTLKQKIIGTILALSGSIGNYFGIDKLGMILRKQFGDKKKIGGEKTETEGRYTLPILIIGVVIGVVLIYFIFK